MKTQLQKLAGYDVEVLVDRSDSTRITDCCKQPTRRQAAPSPPIPRCDHIAEQTARFTREVCKVLGDGIYVGLFNTQLTPLVSATSRKLRAALRRNPPADGTFTADALHARIEAYFERKAANPHTKPLFLICVTDGEPNGTTVPGVSRDPQQAVADIIIGATRRMKDSGEIRILFVQIGNCGKARAFLLWLANGLTPLGAVYDIVESVTATEASSAASITKEIAEALR